MNKSLIEQLHGMHNVCKNSDVVNQITTIISESRTGIHEFGFKLNNGVAGCMSIDESIGKIKMSTYDGTVYVPGVCDVLSMLSTENKKPSPQKIQELNGLMLGYGKTMAKREVNSRKITEATDWENDRTKSGSYSTADIELTKSRFNEIAAIINGSNCDKYIIRLTSTIPRPGPTYNIYGDGKKLGVV